jgi:hypothetical protein
LYFLPSLHHRCTFYHRYTLYHRFTNTFVLFK